MKDWVNFHILLQLSVQRKKLKALLKKSAVAIPAVVGLRQSLKRTIPSSRFFRAFVFFLWSFCYCGATENVGDFLGILVQPQRFVGSVSCLFLVS